MEILQDADVTPMARFRRPARSWPIDGLLAQEAVKKRPS
jgi:hypothetical protein